MCFMIMRFSVTEGINLTALATVKGNDAYDLTYSFLVELLMPCFR